MTDEMRFGLLRAPRYVIFGPGTVAAVGPIASEFGTRVLACLDGRLPGTITEPVLASLAAAGLIVQSITVDDVPTPAAIEAAAGAVLHGPPDVIVAVGGGATLDMGKLLALCLSQGGPMERFYGENHVPALSLPVVGVPTTAGTGSEVSPVSVLHDPALDRKVVVSSPYTIPVAAICDPSLTASCPPTVTAHAGLDALANAIESYTSARRLSGWRPLVENVFVGSGVLSEHYALAAAGLIGRHLGAAFDDGSDGEARSGVALGSLMAGLAFAQSGTALVHAINYPIEAALHTPHGLGVALLLPHVMQFNRATRTPELARIGAAMGVAADGADPATAAEAAISHVEQLNARLGVPGSLRELGLEQSRLAGLAAEASAITRLVNNNGRPANADDVAHILESAWLGERSRLASANELVGVTADRR